MIHKCLFLFSLLLLSACGKDSQVKVDKAPSTLGVAYNDYQKQDYAKAHTEFFALSQKSNLSKDKQHEAMLGSVICAILAGDEQWQNYLSNWSVEERYFWQSQSFDAVDGLVGKNLEYFRSLPLTPEDKKLFFVLHFLIQQKHHPFIQTVAKKLSENKDWKNFCLAHAWGKLIQGKYQEGIQIFQSIMDVMPEKATDIEQGILMGQLLLGKMPKNIPWQKLPTKKYSFGVIYKEVFRSSSPIQPIAKASDKNLQMLTFIDSIYTFGKLTQQSNHVWQTGINTIDGWEDFSPQWAQLTKQRFFAAISWQHLIAGNYPEARKGFEELSSNENEHLQKEGELGLAILYWKEEFSLDEIDNNIGKSWPIYWLGGKKFNFYRIQDRLHRQKEIDQLANTKGEHLSYLILLDVLCLLGDGRSANSLLSNVIENHTNTANTKQLYMAEQNYIPKDSYAENQIWEKMD
jgi:hypothetical protein